MQERDSEPVVLEDVDDHAGLTFEVEEEDREESGKTVRNKGIYLLPNLITTAALFSGFYAIIAAMKGIYDKAALAVFVAALFDGMDGRVARMTNTQSAFGAEYDSLSDMVSFGVAPALIVYSFSLQSLGKLGWMASFVYTAAAAFRLARFNVQIGQVDKRYFIGLSSPLAASVICSLVWAGVDNGVNVHVPWVAVAIALLTVLTAFFMISNFRYYSFKEFDRSRVPFAMMLPAVFVICAVASDLPIGILAVTIVYALSGPVAALWGRNRRKQVAT